MKTILLAVSMIGLSASAWAEMGGAEFMNADLMPKITETRKCVQRYVQYGYKKVPDEYKLSSKMDDVIRRDGLGARGTGFICDEAAKELGMVR